MLNKARGSIIVSAVAVLCVTTAGSAAAGWELQPNGCLKHSVTKAWDCTVRDAGKSGTAGPAYQPTVEQVQIWQKISGECQNRRDFAQAAQGHGIVVNLDSDDFYQKRCVSSGDPAVAAREVVASMQLPVPSVGMTPRPGPDSVILVGYNVWMWVDPELFAPVSAVATLDGTSIGVTGRVVRVDWDMGDGNVVRCTVPGTPYVLERDGLAASPDCGHVYTNKQGEMTVTATAHWELEWFGGGQSGTVTDTTVSTIPVTVGEWQVRIRRG